MTATVTTEQMLAASRRLLERAATLAAAKGSWSELPLHEVRVGIMEASGPSGYVTRVRVRQEPDLQPVLDAIREELEDSEEWGETKRLLEQYIEENAIKPAASFFVGILVTEELLNPLIVSYFKSVGSISDDEEAASASAHALVDHITSKEISLRTLIVLEGFKAENDFEIEPYIQIRAINDSDLLDIGVHRENRQGFEGRPRTDWWVCELWLPNPRGTREGWDKALEFKKTMAAALRAFKTGGFKTRLGVQRAVGPFESLASHYDDLETVASGPGAYSLSVDEVAAFKSFWPRFRELMEKEAHYLQLPIRRLRGSGSRAEREDALIDCVVGLEALLCKRDEGTEIGYRFRIRGSVLLAGAPAERRGVMKKLEALYNLRSRIVHGTVVPPARLRAELPLAEDALRRVWKWYFDKWYETADNNKGIEEIDAQLIGAVSS